MGVAKGILKNAHIYQPSPAPSYSRLGALKGLWRRRRIVETKIVERSRTDEAQYFSSTSGSKSTRESLIFGIIDRHPTKPG